MKNIGITRIKTTVSQLIKKASFELPPDIKKALGDFRKHESGSTARQVLDLIMENSRTASQEKLPLCQDCGSTYIDLKIGPGICIEDSANLYGHLDDAVSKALKTEWVETPIGKIKFDERGDAIGADFSVYQVRNGAYEEVK